MTTKIFCDIAELDQIKKFNKKKIVKGFTTNPSLMRKAGAKDYKSYSKKILKICKNKPVSFLYIRQQILQVKQVYYCKFLIFPSNKTYSLLPQLFSLS